TPDHGPYHARVTATPLPRSVSGTSRGHATPWELREARRSLMGPGQEEAIAVDQPTITGRTHSAPDARSPLFACLCRSVRRTQTAGLSAFFLETEARGPTATGFGDQPPEPIYASSLTMGKKRVVVEL